MSALRQYLRRFSSRPMVRPMALVGPVLVLLICLPMLRPLRHPSDVSDDELLRLATIESLVTAASLELSPRFSRFAGTVQHDGRAYSAQPPMMALLLSLPAWLLLKMGLSFEDNQLLIAYLLTLLGVTLPVSGACGLIYRMGRLFELRRLWRVALSIAVVVGGGLISYAVVLNAQAPTAALVVAAAACLIHVAGIERAGTRWVWMLLSGGAAGLATTLDPSAGIFLLLFMFVIAAMRFPVHVRASAVGLYLIGAAAPLWVHLRWDPLPGTQRQSPEALVVRASDVTSLATASPRGENMEPQSASLWSAFFSPVHWLLRTLVGSHGLISHFPIVIVGVAGVFAVMHRHWPATTKVLAAATLAGSITIVVLCLIEQREADGASFASPWFVVFTPILLFWLGAWVRRRHAAPTWASAGVLLGFSMLVGLIGVTGPTPRAGFDGYTAVSAAMRLLGKNVDPDTRAVEARPADP